MNKYLLLAHGEMDTSPNAREAHQRWWMSIQGHVVDSGNPLREPTDVARKGEVGSIDDPALGYSIVEAESMEAAIGLLELCPIDMWVYEAVPMP